MNRLKQKTADLFFSTGACAPGAGPAGLATPCGAAQISYTYTATGRRLTMSDATGTTNYGYDLRDRLLTKASPFGTLTYTFDAAGNIQSLKSSNVGGAAMTYGYDALNRLASATDASGVTTYSYDAVGNLSGYVYPNGVSTGYGYDPLNRLTNMQSTCATGTGCGVLGSPVASYAYTLGAAGNRVSVAELSGRTVNYGYDDLYRLTSENITCGTAAGCGSGNVSYQYDSVGNRLQRNSTLPAIIATGLLNYDANDRTATDPYDANGNLLNGGVGSNIYDFENHMVAAGGVSLVYDGDGNRVQETVAGVTTSYLVADQNLTGYAQVLDELQGGVVSRTYSYGLSLINEQQSVAGAPTTSFYGFDGHGSVRFLTSSTGAITDTYDYDAFGSLIASTGSTPNNYRFAGEQFDPLLGIYYNRARYYDQRLGRFWSMDTWEGTDDEPASLHKYLGLLNDPVDNVDHCGKCVPSNGNYGDIVQELIFEDFTEQTGSSATDISINRILNQSIPDWQGGKLRPDLIDTTTFQNVGQIYEIKSIYSVADALVKVGLYIGALNKFDKDRKWIPGFTYLPPPILPVDASTIAFISRPFPGVITYCLVNQIELAGLAFSAATTSVLLDASTAVLVGAYGF